MLLDDYSPADSNLQLTWIAVLIVLLVSAFFFPRIKNSLAQLFIPLSYIRNSYDTILRTQSNYYNKLSPKEKDRFIKRVYFFLRGKDIYGIQGLVLGQTEKITIAAAAVQLTFGLEANSFPDFDRIIVHTDAYTSPIDHLSHRGDTVESGGIQLAWKYFEEGNAIADDGVNLGLHEMTHALEIEKMIKGTAFRGSFANAYTNWQTVAEKEMVTMRQNHGGFLRSYASANLHEFFACCVEAFFEQSASFKEKLPELYEKTCTLLRQDPARNIFRLR